MKKTAHAHKEAFVSRWDSRTDAIAAARRQHAEYREMVRGERDLPRGEVVKSNGVTIIRIVKKG